MAKLTTAQKAEQRIAEIKQQGIDQMLKLDVLKSISKLNLMDAANYLLKNKLDVKSKMFETLQKALKGMEKAESKLFDLLKDAITSQVGEITEATFIDAMHVIEECSTCEKYPYQLSVTYSDTDASKKTKRTRKPRTKKPTEGCIEMPHAIPTEGSISTNE